MSAHKPSGRELDLRLIESKPRGVGLTAAREPERVLAAAGRVDVRVEVVGHGGDVLVAHVVAQRLQEQDVAVRFAII